MAWSNPERKREYDREWYQKNKEKRKMSNKLYYQKTKKERSIKQKEYRRKNLYNYYKLGAKRRKINFDIEKEEFEIKINNPCHYCGQEKDIGIDRVDYKKGYTKENTIPCCRMCNRMKNIFSYNDFIEKCKQIASYLN